MSQNFRILVLIGKATGNIYSGTCTITDVTGVANLFKSSQVTFADFSFPVGPVEITGIVSQFTKAQLIVRTENDIKP
ncbi:MAG: DUF5689 domain-containing protein [Saprospiraceae bacterium]